MKTKHLRGIILLGTLVLACLLVIQLYWFRKAFDVAEKQFDHSVQIALRKVADSVSKDAEIRKMSSNFFFVTTNSQLNDQELDSLLRNEFSKRSLSIDYELGVYNAADDTLVYGHYVEATRRLEAEKEQYKRSLAEKNFAVYFPKKQSYVAAQLDVWIFSTIILLLMMGFFAYAIASLLRERKFAELKSDFINNMTHEFKTPVTNIRIAGEILQNKIQDQGTQVYVNILLKENERLRQKIDQVLSGASIEYMKRPVLEAMDIHRLIEDCAEAFQLKIRERNGTIRLEFQAGQVSILGDKDLLLQAITNVIDNAEKYSLESPHILVRTRDHGDQIEIDVIDNGIGIAPQHRSKVFDKFFRVTSGNIHNVKGFGLGLSFVKGVVQAHRGHVNLLSELNKGTEVQIILPKV
ncbi:MAG TPA: HAMP domain-containing sensor histidine kinase [Ohtaekwangia sp.]|uniref:sensor histidine kinase n=1 Tax=Ohtaekwangia sp. TaxID=2066019 RepID=UPI002F9480E9